MFNTPILFLIFNRPDLTKVTFNRIKEIQPKQLFIAADGPRKDKIGENQLCQETREIILKNIDWDCDVKTLLRDKNLGCRKAVSNAIDWFFENVEYGIIIEDDILPDPSFFQYSSELLKKYENDNRILSISGTNYNIPNINVEYSYFFSKYVSIWGWATWKGKWKLYRETEEYLNKIIYLPDSVRPLFLSETETQHRIQLIKNVLNNKTNSWGYIWSFANYLNHGLTIIPKNNLVCNIGFSITATHTKDVTNRFSNLKSYSAKFPLISPPFLIRSYNYENSYFPQFNQKNYKNQNIKLSTRLKSFLKRKF